MISAKYWLYFLGVFRILDANVKRPGGPKKIRSEGWLLKRSNESKRLAVLYKLPHQIFVLYEAEAIIAMKNLNKFGPRHIPSFTETDSTGTLSIDSSVALSIEDFNDMDRKCLPRGWDCVKGTTLLKDQIEADNKTFIESQTPTEKYTLNEETNNFLLVTAVGDITDYDAEFNQIPPQHSGSADLTQMNTNTSFATSVQNLTRTIKQNESNNFVPNNDNNSELDFAGQSMPEISLNIFDPIYLEPGDCEQVIENIEPEERRFANEVEEDLPSFYIHDSNIDRIRADLKTKEAETLLSKQEYEKISCNKAIKKEELEIIQMETSKNLVADKVALEKFELNLKLKKKIATENETIEEAKLLKLLRIEELRGEIEKKKRKRQLRQKE